jgi:hypothetical protein
MLRDLIPLLQDNIAITLSTETKQTSQPLNTAVRAPYDYLIKVIVLLIFPPLNST